jgi:hypothetical protein
VSPYYDNALGLVTLLPELQPDRIRIGPLASASDGIELSSRRPLGAHINIWGTYAVSKAYDQLPIGELPRSWDQRQAANVGLSWKDQRNTASILVSWHTGWPRTALSEIIAAPPSPSSALLGTLNQLRWGIYLNVDLHLAHNFPTPIGEFSLWLDLINATNRNNDCCAELAPLVPPAALPSWSTDS